MLIPCKLLSISENNHARFQRQSDLTHRANCKTGLCQTTWSRCAPSIRISTARCRGTGTDDAIDSIAEWYQSCKSVTMDLVLLLDFHAHIPNKQRRVKIVVAILYFASSWVELGMHTEFIADLNTWRRAMKWKRIQVYLLYRCEFDWCIDTHHVGNHSTPGSNETWTSPTILKCSSNQSVA